ncbi:MAG: site-specific integrase [Acidobacteriota bacterium]
MSVYRNEMRLGNIERNTPELSELPHTAMSAAHRSASRDEDGDEVAVENRRALTREEFAQLWRVAQQPLIVLIDLAGRNGLRPSEARALRWECIDFDAGELTVNKQMSSDDTLGPPKTKRSYRTIPIDDQTTAVLSAWRTRQAQKRERARDLWSNEHGLVITTRYGTAINRSNSRRMVTAACTDAAFDPIVPYELRHTAITFQLEAGHPAWKVADWAGTSERMIEQIYRHRISRVASIGPADLAPEDWLGPATPEGKD